MGLYDLTVYDLIRRNAINLTDKAAFIDNERRCTFKEFKDMVDSLANGLLNAGVKKGDRICVLAKNSLEYFALYGAAAKIGAIMLVINWRLSEAEAIGPVLLGMAKPVHVLQRGVEVADIVNMTALCVVDAQELERDLQLELGSTSRS